ncbi:MAG: EAL domain-containing protein [Pseudopelagicola sp.]|nr:EAL domain-containing protein [Pseudopelagicola sp.]
MGRMRKRELADLAPGDESPLDAAVVARDSRVLSMVREAVEHKQVLLAFQPVVSATQTNRPIFHEALIRVLDETGRIIPAKDFMASVAEDELGRMLDCLALEKSLKTLAKQPDLRLSVNMSARSIGYPLWKDTIEKGLSKRPDIAGRLILELSESSVLHVPELLRGFMDDLQPRGIAFAIDDFGARQGALRTFKDFFFDMLKLDGRLIRNLNSDVELQAIVAGTAAISNSLGMVTVASRVQKPEEAKTLAALGVDCLQGFLFGAPTVSPPWDERGRRKKGGWRKDGKNRKNNQDAA